MQLLEVAVARLTPLNRHWKPSGGRPLALTVNTPVLPELVRFVTPAPPISGLLLIAVGEQTTPRVMVAEDPSSVTLPPRVAVVEVMLENKGLLTLGKVGVNN